MPFYGCLILGYFIAVLHFAQMLLYSFFILCRFLFDFRGVSPFGNTFYRLSWRSFVLGEILRHFQYILSYWKIAIYDEFLSYWEIAIYGIFGSGFVLRSILIFVFGLFIRVNFSLGFSGLFRSEFSTWFFFKMFTWIALNFLLYFIYFPGSFFVCPGRIRIIQLLAAYNLPIIALFGILLLFWKLLYIYVYVSIFFACD